MCHELKRDRGFALPAAIFVLVVLAAIVAAMMRIGSGQVAEQSLSLQMTRAHWASQSGLEWGTYTVKNGAAGNCFSTTGLTIGNFTVTVSCTVAGYAEASASNNVFRYNLRAEAVSTGLGVDHPDYVYRAVEASLVRRI